jgi:predicted RNA-binding protein with TRAM domain
MCPITETYLYSVVTRGEVCVVYVGDTGGRHDGHARKIEGNLT